MLVDIGLEYISASISSYTPFSVPVSSSTSTIDSALIEIYGGLKYGTEFKVDHLEFEYGATGTGTVEDFFSPVIFQNPFDEELVVNTPPGFSSVYIFSPNGNQVFHFNLFAASTNRLNIDASTWTSGIYLCVFRNEEKKMVRKIMKQ